MGLLDGFDLDELDCVWQQKLIDDLNLVSCCAYRGESDHVKECAATGTLAALYEVVACQNTRTRYFSPIALRKIMILPVRDQIAR